MRLLIYLEDPAESAALSDAAYDRKVQYKLAGSVEEVDRLLAQERFEAVVTRRGPRELAFRRFHQVLQKRAPDLKLYLLGEESSQGVAGLGELGPAAAVEAIALDHGETPPSEVTFDVIEQLVVRRTWKAAYARSYKSGREGLVMFFGLDEEFGTKATLESVLAVEHPLLPKASEVQLEDSPYVLWEVPQEGTALAHVLWRAGGRLEPDVALAVVCQVCEALEALHARGVVHGWVDLEAVWLVPDGTLRLPYGGLAALAEQAAHNTRGPAWATPRSNPEAAPEEVALQKPTAATDVYRAGQLLYQLVAGKLPFAGRELFETLQAIKSEPAPPLAAAPSLAALVARTLEKDPALRPRDGGALRRELEAVRGGGGLARLLRRPKAPREVVADCLRALPRA